MTDHMIACTVPTWAVYRLPGLTLHARYYQLPVMAFDADGYALTADDRAGRVRAADQPEYDCLTHSEGFSEWAERQVARKANPA